ICRGQITICSYNRCPISCTFHRTGHSPQKQHCCLVNVERLSVELRGAMMSQSAISFLNISTHYYHISETHTHTNKTLLFLQTNLLTSCNWQLLMIFPNISKSHE